MLVDQHCLDEKKYFTENISNEQQTPQLRGKKSIKRI